MSTSFTRKKIGFLDRLSVATTPLPMIGTVFGASLVLAAIVAAITLIVVDVFHLV